MTGGRPLRFLALTLGGWVTVRVMVLLPGADPIPGLIRKLVPTLLEAFIPVVAAAVFDMPRPPPATVWPAAPVLPPTRPKIMPTLPSDDTPRTPAASPQFVLPSDRPISAIPSPSAPPARVNTASRLQGSAWLLVRGGPAGTLSGGQLGASQGGVRVTYALDTARRFALAARIAAPLKGAGREAALGIEWQPTSLPIRLIAEQRFSLDGGRGGPTVGVIGGYGPAEIVHGVRLEAYGQAGAIARDGIEGFVDASVRVTHKVGQVGPIPVDIGLGAWGSAQRGASRFDIGPSLTATIPVARKTVRLTLDWRERVAGGARPGSGPAFSIGSDF